ncbi:MAG TPA: nicotinate-nucleotide adenylyltransferase [Kiloniellales bacterium]|nr:nicotinate-nucleotide adenylyltransferase [Kiloniellales bacterium]
MGLLGGSFNPAHEAHLMISREALRRLRLDGVWWLVSPQNPLKGRAETAPLAERLRAAQAFVGTEPRIRACALESVLGTVYTAETLDRLAALFPQVRFVWLMGADNLVQVSSWKDWARIFHRAPVAVFDRPSYSQKALSSVAARRFARHRLPERRAGALATEDPPAWVFLHCRRSARSSTELRRARERAASRRGGGAEDAKIAKE